MDIVLDVDARAPAKMTLIFVSAPSHAIVVSSLRHIQFCVILDCVINKIDSSVH